MSEQPLKDLSGHLSALALRQFADDTALLSLALSIANHVGLHELDDVPLKQWFELKRRSAVQKYLLALENEDPASAALIQKWIDEFDWPSF